MKDMLDDIPDDNLRNKLRDYSEDPDDSVWENIASGLRHDMPLSERLQTYVDLPDERVWTAIKTGVALDRLLRRLERIGMVVAFISMLVLTYPFMPIEPKSEHVQYAKTIESKVTDDRIENSENSDAKSQDISETSDRIIAKEKANVSTTTKNNIVDKAKTSKQNVAQPLVSGKNKVRANQDVSMPSNSAIIAKKGSSDKRGELNQITETFFDEMVLNEDDKKRKADALTNSNDDFITRTNNGGFSTSTDSVSNEIVTVAKTKDEQKTSAKPEQKKKSKRRIHGGFYMLLMPTFGYQRITPAEDDNILIESIEKVSTFSRKRLGMRGEIGIERSVIKKFSYHAGFLYYQRQQTINYVFKDPASVRVEASSADYSYQLLVPLDSGTFQYELKNIGVVIGLNYTTNVKKFVHKVGIAGELHKSLRQVHREADTGQRYFVFGNLYYRVSYPVSSKLELMFQPTINYALQVDNRVNAPFYVKPYGLGLNLGAYFHF